MHVTERFMRIQEVLQRTSLSRSTVYQYIEIGLFPQQIKVGKRAVCWLESDVTEWIEERVAHARRLRTDAGYGTRRV
jgi:prophage regulatory protein